MTTFLTLLILLGSNLLSAPSDPSVKLEKDQIRAQLSTTSLGALRRAIARGEHSAQEIRIELDLWRRYILLSRDDPKAHAKITREIETFETAAAWLELDADRFETLAEALLRARGTAEPRYHPKQFQDRGLAYSRSYVRWALLQRRHDLDLAGRLLLASDRARGDGLWWEEVDQTYWAAETAGAKGESLEAFRAILRGYAAADFDALDLAGVDRRTSAEFMRLPSIWLAFDEIEKARALRHASR